MEKTTKKTLRDEIEEKTGAITTPTEVHLFHTLIAGKFPIKLWEQWKENCKANFNDIYWNKIWTDHLKAQAYDNLMNTSVQKTEVSDDKKEDIPLIGDGGK